ncbi:MAG: hypothetical protein ACRC62_14890 [Microcoleus sp.]
MKFKVAKQKLRSLIVDATTYLWVFKPSYQLVDATAYEYRCYDVFKAYAESNYTSPLRIIFITWECAICGGPLRVGAPVIIDNPNTSGVNLHTPKWAAGLIREGLKRGWQANAHSVPFTIENGVELLADLNYTAD